jgi:hypothetical protein
MQVREYKHENINMMHEYSTQRDKTLSRNSPWIYSLPPFGIKSQKAKGPKEEQKQSSWV